MPVHHEQLVLANLEMASSSLLRGEGVFEITDYTTASDWERFISGLEEILTDWKLSKQSREDGLRYELPAGFVSRGLWHEKLDTLNFGQSIFDVRYQYLDCDSLKQTSCTAACKDEYAQETSIEEFHDAIDESEQANQVSIQEEHDHGEHELPREMPECLVDMTCSSNDFASKAHCLVRWYNLRRFIVLIPKGDSIVSTDKVNLLLSSASIALANIDCHVPVFVQIQNLKSNFYQGISEHLNIRSTYEMIYQTRYARQYSYLSELVSLFREKTGSNLNDPITLAIRINYCLDSFELFTAPSNQFDGNEYCDDDDDDESKEELVRMTERKKEKLAKMRGQDLRSGATFEQVKEALVDCLAHPFRILRFLHVAAVWPSVSDKIITDSQVHSDLDAAEAPVWVIRCVSSDNCNMKIVHETQAVHELLLAAVRFAYDKVDGEQTFAHCDRKTLEAACLSLSYELATQPEVILSSNPSDPMRKIVALLFYRAHELRCEQAEALDQIASRLRRPASLSEIYRDFSRINKPSVKEFILRSRISRPFSPISSPALPQRMFCTVCEDELRLCGAFSELSS